MSQLIDRFGRQMRAIVVMNGLEPTQDVRQVMALVGIESSAGKKRHSRIARPVAECSARGRTNRGLGLRRRRCIVPRGARHPARQLAEIPHSAAEAAFAPVPAAAGTLNVGMVNSLFSQLSVQAKLI